MNSNKKAAKIVGVLFLLAAVTAIIGAYFIRSYPKRSRLPD